MKVNRFHEDKFNLPNSFKKYTSIAELFSLEHFRLPIKRGIRKHSKFGCKIISKKII